MGSTLDRPAGDLIRLDWEKGLYLLLILLALVTRLWGLGDRPQSHDESIHARFSWDLYIGRGFAHNPWRHGPFLYHATALSYFFLGDNDFTARVPVALMGVALVGFPYLLRRWLGRSGALVTSFFLLVSPAIAFYSRYIRHDIPTTLWAVTVAGAMFSYLRDGRARWLYVMAAGVSLMFATKEVAFIYGGIFGLYLVIRLVVEVLRQRWAVAWAKAIFQAALVIAFAGVALVGLGLVLNPKGTDTASWITAGSSLLGAAGARTIVTLLRGTGSKLYRRGSRLQTPALDTGEPSHTTYRTVDLIIVLGTLCLPFLSPFLIKPVGTDPTDYTEPAIFVSAGVGGGFLLISGVIGFLWDRRRWLVCAGIHYFLFAIFFTTVFSNGSGVTTGLIGSLGYWLEQQAVERGSQPVYYYAVMVLFYEFLPLLLSAVAMIVLIVRTWATLRVRPRSHLATANQRRPSSESGFVPFLLWWTAASWASYSLAGERMPWLTVHIAFPMLLLSGWVVGQWIDRVKWRRLLADRARLLVLVVPALAMASISGIDAAIAGPFQGFELDQLNVTGRLTNGLLGTLVFGSIAASLVRHSGWRIAMTTVLLPLLLMLAFLTIRTAFRFCYVNYDYPIEFLVYAHAAPPVNEAMRRIEDLSRRVYGDPYQIGAAYGDDGSTLFYWQFRNFPSAVYYGENPTREQMELPVIIAGRPQWETVEPYLGDDYLVSTHTYVWFPIEDYRDLTWPRIVHAVTDRQTRTALWDIWYNRDYTRYDELTGKQHTVDAWPDRFHLDFRLYIRRDVAGQVWDLPATE